MVKYAKRSIPIVIFLLFFPAVLAAQTFVYTNNDLATPGNSVSAFAVDSSGNLSQVSGSPFSTGGLGHGGGLYSSNRIVVIGNFLYASNAGDNTISAFTIDASTGGLTAVSGSPFPIQGFDNPNESGISLAATPDGKFLYAGTTDGNVTILSINTTGALTLAASAPVAADGPIASLKVSPNGSFLVAAIVGLNKEIEVFAIRSDGSLRAIHKPYLFSSDTATSMDINCASSLVYVGTAGGNIYALNLNGKNGHLGPVAGSPFATGLQSNQVAALSADDTMLFSSNQGGNTVTAFAVNTDGSLVVPGTSVSVAGSSGVSNLYPGGLAVSQDGQFLFAADNVGDLIGNAGVTSFLLNSPSSPLTFGTLASTGIMSQLHSVAAYPAKACATAVLPSH